MALFKGMHSGFWRAPALVALFWMGILAAPAALADDQDEPAADPSEEAQTAAATADEDPQGSDGDYASGDQISGPSDLPALTGPDVKLV